MTWIVVNPCMGEDMAVDPDVRLWLEDTLGRILPVRTRPMFGGLGIWSGELFFALADDDTLYVKGDAETWKVLEDGGASRFRPFGDDGPTMDYWNVPTDVLEDPVLLAEWVELGLGAAVRGKRKKRRPSR